MFKMHFIHFKTETQEEIRETDLLWMAIYDMEDNIVFLGLIYRHMNARIAMVLEDTEKREKERGVKNETEV